MGSVPQERYQSNPFLSLLQSGQVRWTSSRQVHIQRGTAGKLGIKLKVFTVSNKKETYCIISSVKPECRLLNDAELKIQERVIEINNYSITQCIEERVFQLIESINSDIITLTVCGFEKVKRSRDQLSSSSDSSNTMEVMKKVKDVKRGLIKPNCVDKKEPSEHDALLNDKHHMTHTDGSPISGVGCMGGSNMTTISLPPASESPAIIEEERFTSLPNPLTGCKECIQCKNNNMCCGGNNHVLQMVPLSKSGSNSSWTKSVGFAGSYEDLFRFPHRVKWDCETKAVTLTTSHPGKFGFKYRVKEFKTNVEEWYTLVLHVNPDGPADGKLFVGDWIRSIDGHALTSAIEAVNLEQMLENLKQVRIVLQRPEGMLHVPKYQQVLEKQSRSPEIESPVQFTSAMPPLHGHDYNSKLSTAVPVPGSCSPKDKSSGRQDIYCRQSSAKSHGSASSKRSTGSNDFGTKQVPVYKVDIKPKPMNQAMEDMFSVVRKQNSLDCESIDTKSNLTSQTNVDEVQIIVPDMQQTSIDAGANGLDVQHINQTVKLPKVRIFICGSEARQFSKLLFPENLPLSENTLRLYDHIKCTMTMNRAGLVIFMPWSQYNHLIQSEEKSMFNMSSDSQNQNDISNSVLYRGAINTEFFVVPDEKFFNNCCQYLFTGTSIFLLTFNGDKVLQSAAGEISKIQNMIHTIRCFVPYKCPILTYGLLGSDQSEIGSNATFDEVRTLFYTSYGNQIKKYNVPIPNLFRTYPSEDHSREVRLNVWKAICDTEQKQYVLLVSVAMMHRLEQKRQQGQVYITEDEFTDMMHEIVPNTDQGTKQVVQVELQDFGEIMSSKAAPITGTSLNLSQLDKLLFIDPHFLLSSIHHLQMISPRDIQSNEVTRQIWQRLIGVGIITHENLRSLIPNYVLNTDQMVSLLQAFGLIFEHSVATPDCKQYFVPCFLPEQNVSDMPKANTYDGCLCIQFLGHLHVSSMMFFQLAFSLSKNSNAKSISIPSTSCCIIHHLGVQITLVHHKLKERIQVLISKVIKADRLLKWLCDVCESCVSSLGADIKYVIGPICPLKERCCYLSDMHRNSGDIHVLDLSKGIPIMCGNVKVDNHRSVKEWLRSGSTIFPVSPTQKFDRQNNINLQDSETGSNASIKSAEAPQLQMYIKDMPYHLFHNVFKALQMESIGRDWKCLAGLMGFTVEQTLMYETKDDPAKLLLIDLDQTRRVTIGQLIEHLSMHQMERFDIIEKLTEWLNNG